MPGLEKEKKPSIIKKEDTNMENELNELNNDLALEDKILNESKIETQDSESYKIKLFLLKADFLTSNSKVTNIDVHRKLFNDSIVNFLKNRVNLKQKNLMRKVILLNYH